MSPCATPCAICILWWFFGVIGNYTSIGIILIAPLGQPAAVLSLSPFHLWITIASALIGITAAHGLYYVAIQQLGVSISALALMVTPFITLLAGYVFIGERLSLPQVAGGLVLVAGAALALWSRQRANRRAGGPIEPSPD